MLAIHIVWYKRDLRASDHRPLTTAAAQGAVLPLYIIEPAIIHAADYDRRHYDFTRDCLLSLRHHLAELGQPLVVRVGEAPSIFDDLRHQYDLRAIYAHEETGNALTYARDIALRQWAKSHDIPLHETPANGVIRPLRNRDQRTRLWHKQIAGDPLPRPPRLEAVEGLEIGSIPTWDELGIRDEGIQARQAGGELEGRRVLGDFLRKRAHDYPRGMSSPLTADWACSRISPHLAYGTLSLRQVFFALRKRQAQVAGIDTRWERALRSL